MSRRWPTIALAALVLPFVGCIFALFVMLPLLALLTHRPWDGLGAVLGNTVSQSAIEVSLVSTTVATALTTIFGVPLGYVLARYRFPGRSLITGIVYLPLVLPPLVAGVLLELVWGQSGTIEQFLQPHGILFVNELSGIVLCQMFVCSPFIVVVSRSAFERVHQDLDEAARTMGADTLRIFWLIAVPLSLRSILAGVTLSWMRSFGEFGATAIVAYHPFSFPTYLYNFVDVFPFSQTLTLALLAVILGAGALTVFAVLERVGAVRMIVDQFTALRPQL